eukprot:767617-Hanusia_phi.AAC.10
MKVHRGLMPGARFRSPISGKHVLSRKLETKQSMQTPYEGTKKGRKDASWQTRIVRTRKISLLGSVFLMKLTSETFPHSKFLVPRSSHPTVAQPYLHVLLKYRHHHLRPSTPLSSSLLSCSSLLPSSPLLSPPPSSRVPLPLPLVHVSAIISGSSRILATTPHLPLPHPSINPFYLTPPLH